eukprot:335691-Karenia_brevis.AAC.1
MDNKNRIKRRSDQAYASASHTRPPLDSSHVAVHNARTQSAYHHPHYYRSSVFHTIPMQSTGV